jgi:cytosine/adenosine deaminase-related metal-dependent hydrolase
VSAERAERRYREATRQAEALAGGGLTLLRAGLSPHAPYSVWPSLWRRADRFCAERGLRWSSHLLESPFEDAFLRDGTGPLRDHLEGLGVWDGSFPVPGVSPVELLESEGVLGERALFVHGVHLSDAGIARVAASGASICLCPRSNRFLGLPSPPVRSLIEHGVSLCLGTDSLASNHDLSVWGEMRELAEIAPGLTDPAIVALATAGGARALGFEDRFGTLEAGKEARLLAVDATGSGDRDPCRILVREGAERPRRHLVP